MQNTLDELVEEMGITVADCEEIPMEKPDEEMTVESIIYGKLTSLNVPTQETVDGINWFLEEAEKIKKRKDNNTNHDKSQFNGDHNRFSYKSIE